MLLKKYIKINALCLMYFWSDMLVFILNDDLKKKNFKNFNEKYGKKEVFFSKINKLLIRFAFFDFYF